MNSFIETTQEATTDYQQLNNKLLANLKTYTFFLFYVSNSNHKQNTSLLEKLSFRLKTLSNNPTQQEQNISDQMKQIDIRFYDLNNQNQILNAISDVRYYAGENKIKIIINASEEYLVFLVQQFEFFKVDISHVPLIINSDRFKSDLTTFLGWQKNLLSSISAMHMPYFHSNARNWIKSTTEKIDLWKVNFSVGKEGKIFRLINNQLIQQSQKNLEDYFLSHFCIGYHATVHSNCSTKIKNNQETVSNFFIESLEKFKRFCCVGSQNLKATTGIANISLIDEKGQELELLKHLKPGDSSQEQSQVQFKGCKYRQYRDVLSILLTNLNLFDEKMLDKSVEGKIYDGKLELITFSSLSEHRKICSTGGDINIKLQAQVVDIEVGESMYRLQHPSEIKISFHKKLKIGLHNKVVMC